MDLGYTIDGRKLKDTRLKRGLTQAELCLLGGWDKTTLFRWESGRTTPTPNNLRRISAMLGKLPEEFLILDSDNGRQ